MKKVWVIMIAFLIFGSGSAVFGQYSRGNRYNPYDPYHPPEKRATAEKSPTERDYLNNAYGADSPQYERDFLTRSYIAEYNKGVEEDYFTNPYGTIPGRWYDNESRYSGGAYGRSLQPPGVLANPYGDASPRQIETKPNPNLPRDRASMEREYFTPPYGSDPRRWYDSPVNYQGTSQKTLESPKPPSGPYSTKDARSYSSEVLTSPYEGIVPQRRSAVSSNQELTPPAIK